jgi:hypothetical protein
LVQVTGVKERLAAEVRCRRIKVKHRLDCGFIDGIGGHGEGVATQGGDVKQWLLTPNVQFGAPKGPRRGEKLQMLAIRHS